MRKNMSHKLRAIKALSSPNQTAEPLTDCTISLCGEHTPSRALYYDGFVDNEQGSPTSSHFDLANVNLLLFSTLPEIARATRGGPRSLWFGWKAALRSSSRIIRSSSSSVSSYIFILLHWAFYLLASRITRQSGRSMVRSAVSKQEVSYNTTVGQLSQY